MIVLSNFGKKRSKNGVDVSCDVEIDGEKSEISFKITIDDDLASKIEPNPASFLIAMIIPAMVRGEDIFVDGPLESDFLHRVDTYAIGMLHSKNDSYKPINVTCAEIVSAPARTGAPSAAMTGMSCGVDSLRTLMVYGSGDEKIPERYRLKALSVFDVGAFFDPEFEYPRILAKAGKIAAQTDCRIIGVSADFGRFYQDAFSNSCTMRHVACAYSLAEIIGVYLVSSTYEWNAISANSATPTAMESTDPILLPILSSSRLEMFSACANEGRHTKVHRLLAGSEFVQSIDICTRPTNKRDAEKNCGTCAKCADFLLTAESADKLDEFGNCFDLDAFHRRRFRIYQRIFTGITIMRARYPALWHRGNMARSLKVPFGSIFAGYVIGKLILLLQALGLKK